MCFLKKTKIRGQIQKEHIAIVSAIIGVLLRTLNG